MGIRYAVVGATGNVGREILQILAERDVPADDVTALASSRSVGAEVFLELCERRGVAELPGVDVAVGTLGRGEEEQQLVGRGARLLFESPLHLRHGMAGRHVQLVGAAVHTLKLHMNLRRGFGRVGALPFVGGLF